MSELSLVIAPAPILRTRAEPVAEVDDLVRAEVAAMYDILYSARGIGLGANMVGLAKRIIIIDLQEEGMRAPLTMINPEIVSRSEDMQNNTEASLSFPGVEAEITRAQAVTVTFQDETGTPKTLDADGWLAAVIQHEMDYLDGRSFLDHLKPVRRQMLMKKYLKQRRLHASGHQGHGCGDPTCSHDH